MFGDLKLELQRIFKVPHVLGVLSLTPKHQWRTFWLFAVLGKLL
jgi:hypothetical protein